MFVCERPSRWYCRAYGFCSFWGQELLAFFEGSFNAAIAKMVVKALRENGHQVMFHDLYQDNFNPVISKEELASNQTKDCLVALH